MSLNMIIKKINGILVSFPSEEIMNEVLQDLEDRKKNKNKGN
ncbi:hypothetical protein [Acidianus sp. HS-5]|nr:hypothetical protein [Acidianus sp. HS-5]